LHKMKELLTMKSAFYKRNQKEIKILLIAVSLFCCNMEILGQQNNTSQPYINPSQPLYNMPQPDGKPHKFELKDGNFVLDGKPYLILAGEMHLPRVVPEFWDHRIKQAKAMGLNTISIYVMWNQIEPKEGQFNFEGFNDIRRIAKLCQSNGMWLILRPGPYVCAEFEFGGLPAWLIQKKCEMRKYDPVKLGYDRRYIMKLGEQLADLQVHRGGPILMVQVENEHRSIDDYMRELTKYFREAGFDCQLFTCDPGLKTFAPEEGIPGVLRGVNGVVNDTMLYKRVKYLADKNGYPVYNPEMYTAWYSHWGMKINRRPISSEINNAKWLLDRNISYCYYMFFGGTTFGFQNMKAAITSYDYDAPVDEAGRVKPKYHALRDYFIQRLKINPPPIPPDPLMIEIPPVKLARQCALLDVLPQPVVSENTKIMEELGQAYGFVLYRRKFDQGVKGMLDVSKARDYSIVMVNGQPVGRAYLKYGAETLKIQLNQDGPCTLDILVYNLGREQATRNETKGFTGNPTLDGNPLTGWQIFSLPMENPSDLPRSKAKPAGPSFYRGTFKLDKTGETFLDMRNWGYGVVWVNGHNLGRYWDVGASRSLYLPGPWQKKGTNEIVILELRDNPPKALEVAGTTSLIEEEPIPFPEDIKAKK
jgi:beta-galactosidase